jgi:hypothetical protein
MHPVGLIKLYVFMQILDIPRKHYTKNGYFPTDTLFSTIKLLWEQRLNRRNYFEQKIIMRNFVQATDYDFHMHAKLQCINMYIYL